MLFRYAPLNNPKSDLRLIMIQFGQISDRVTCNLIQPGTPALKYQALSYTWGVGGRKMPIIIDEKEFLVTPNLEDALRHLRRSTLTEAAKQLPLWIDAICINQEDSEERDAQVRRMKSIYEQAEQVVIWLGNYNEPSDGTFRLDMSKWKIDRVEDNSEALARSAVVLLFVLKEEACQQQSSEVTIGLEDCQHSNNVQVWLQLSRLLYRPWFERLWVIQELAVSRKAIVQWGNLQTAWSTLENAAKFILRPGDVALPQHVRMIFPLLGAHRITQVALQSMFNVDTQNILTILHNTQNSKCSDPRDRLYAIQGIIEDNQDIEIDYSIPVQHVYRKWTVKRISRTKTLDIFSACADSSRRGDLPSWVPDFREPFGQDKPLWIASQTLAKQSYGRMMKTDGQDSWEFQCRDLRFSEDELKLYLSGKYAGKIDNLTTVGDAVTDLRDPGDLQDRLKQIIANWETTLNGLRKMWGDDFLAPKGFKESILRSFYPWSREPENSDVLTMPYNIWRNDDDRSPSLEDYVKWGYWDVSRHEFLLREFERSLFPRVHGCQMFTIQNGRTGIVAGNCQAQIDDELWLLSGGLTAFIMRRVNHLEHRLISSCYLFGMMYCKDIRNDHAWQSVILV